MTEYNEMLFCCCSGILSYTEFLNSPYFVWKVSKLQKILVKNVLFNVIISTKKRGAVWEFLHDAL